MQKDIEKNHDVICIRTIILRKEDEQIQRNEKERMKIFFLPFDQYQIFFSLGGLLPHKTAFRKVCNSVLVQSPIASWQFIRYC